MQGLPPEGHPVQDRLLRRGPLLRLAWDEFLGDKLGDTIYADMPNSIRTGRVSHRGSRGGKKGGGGKKGANKENSEGESSDEEEG